MKLLRTIGLAVFAAMALIAVAGAGSALATDTTLCKSATSSPYCASGDRYAAKTAIEAKAEGIVTIANSLANIKCGESQLKAETSAAAGSPLPIATSAWTLGQCGTNTKMSNCTSSTEVLSNEGSVLWNKGSSGTLTLAGGKGVGWRLKCPGVFEFDCTFTLDPKATFEGGSSAHIAIPESTLGRSGSVCPKTATLKAVSYGVSSPSPVYVARAEEPGAEEPVGMQFCSVTFNPCPEANTYPSGTSVKLEATNFKIETSKVTFSCEKAPMVLSTQQMTGKPLPVSLTSSSLEYCKATGGFGWCIAISTDLNPGASLPLSWTSGENALLEGLALSWKFTCVGMSETEWTFATPADMYGFFKGGAPPATLSYTGFPGITCKGTWCTGGGALTATYTVTSPTPLYVTHF